MHQSCIKGGLQAAAEIMDPLRQIPPVCGYPIIIAEAARGP